MSLPNYSPEGKVLFGSVPWDNGYSNVRLYTSLDAQYNDISSRMTLSSSHYTYIGRNRTLKVSIEADRLYHCNYCMYRNNSLTDGYIYCFITDVKYINDNTTEITLETDVFNTYLYGVDWEIPACFIERETVPSESDKYLLTAEPNFNLIYTQDGRVDKWFRYGGTMIMSSAYPVEDTSIAAPVLNPDGYFGHPAPATITKGIPRGANMYYVDNVSGGAGPISEKLEQFVNEMTYAGASESIVSVFTIPDFATEGISTDSQGFINTNSYQDEPSVVNDLLGCPSWGNTLDGYTPRNKKLLYYPYTFCRLTDLNGSNSDLRYEMMGKDYRFCIKYEISPCCQALIYPVKYEGSLYAYDRGITTSCGAQGSISVNTYQEWLSRNVSRLVGSFALGAVAGVSGVNMAGVAQGLKASAPMIANADPGAYTDAQFSQALADYGKGIRLGGKANSYMKASAGLIGSAAMDDNAARMTHPNVTRGQINDDVSWACGVQGVHAIRVVCKAEYAQQIDQFFDRFGYDVERIESVNITSRPSWNYVKTGGASPRSTNVGAGSSAPFSRGRGTPAAALSVIRQAFDAGVTFWHTTSGFGDYSLNNSL